MKTHQHQSNHSYLIWLFSFMLLLHISNGNSGSGLMAPLRNIKQTELTLLAFNVKSEKKSHSLFKTIAKHATRFTGDLSCKTRDFQHTHCAVLKWKIMAKHILPSRIDVVHIKVAQNDEDDLSILKG